MPKTEETKEAPKTETKPKAAVKKDAKPKTVKKAKTEKKVVKKPKTTTKKTTKPAKKDVKKTTKKTTTKEKKTETTKTKSDLSNYQKYVIEAIQVKSTEDKPWVGFNAISQYIKEYIPDIKVGNSSRFARNAAEKLAALGYLKQKRNSFSIAKKGKSLVKNAPPKREVVRVIQTEKKLQNDEFIFRTSYT